MRQALKIHHDLADVVLKPTSKVNRTRLKQMICSTLDKYLDEQLHGRGKVELCRSNNRERLPASIIHAETKQHHGRDYRTPGYYLRLYRKRAELTQVVLAKKVAMHQHHLSEMEHNKRPIGKVSAQKLAKVLKCDYHQLL